MRLAAGLVILVVTIGAAQAGDFDTLKVESSVNFSKMIAGPGISGAVLSPDGARLFHVWVKDLCVYDLTGSEPEQLTCVESTARATSPQDAFWSPDGKHLTWPTYEQAFMRFEDTDIQALDAATLALTNLTDDHFADTLMRDGPANLDAAADWLDDDTIVFLRTPIGKEGMTSREPSQLMTVDVGGGETKMLAGPLTEGVGFAIALDVARDRTIAYLVFDVKAPERAGVYLLDPGASEGRLVTPMSALSNEPSGIAFSAEGNYLLAVDWGPEGEVFADMIETSTGTVTPLFGAGDGVAGVAWSPVGTAIAYIVRSNKAKDTPGKLFLAEPPTAPGRLLETGPFMTPICCQLPMMTWARNDTMVLGNMEKMDQPFLIRFQR